MIQQPKILIGYRIAEDILDSKRQRDTIKNEHYYLLHHSYFNHRLFNYSLS